MFSSKLKILLFIIYFIFSISVTAQQYKKFEMRGVWIATVANIDWPSIPGLSAHQQRNEMRIMLDDLAKNNINCIVLQVRPTADAFYYSKLENWSHWLTGEQGKKPYPYYDPLEFIIEEAHKRCMEVHVWINPYRVINSDNLSLLNRDHLYYKNSKLFLKYGGKYYFDPGLDETREYLNKVVADIVERYDIDAVHFDDYFYPYPVNNEAFPDDLTFRNNPRGFAPNRKNDWRRNNVDMVIAELQQTIKSIKPWVEFGISPFGVWRNSYVDPRGSDTRAGVQNYDDLYADILKWLREGTIDYVTPQLYWEIGKEIADYKVLVKWWTENSYGRNLYIGLYASGLQVNNVAAWKRPNEIARQMKMNLDYPQIDGAMFFSARPFLRNLQGLNDTLQNNYYKYPSLNPLNRNISGNPSPQPQNVVLLKDGKEAYLIWDKVEGNDGYQVAYYVVYGFKGRSVGDMNDPANIIAKTIENCLDLHKLEQEFKGRYTFVVTAVNRYRIESAASESVSKRL